MKAARYALMAGMVLVLAACGRAPATGTNESPAASPAASASATAQSSPLAIPGPTLHVGEVALPYSPVAYTAVGGTDPFLWTIMDGSLPGGLNLSQQGVVSGTPTSAGTFIFTVQVTDTTMATANVAGQITIAPRLAAYYVGVMTRGNVIDLCAADTGTCPNADNPNAPFGAISGGVAPYRYAVVAGTLPNEMTLNGFALSGQPRMVSAIRNEEVYTFTIRVTDSFGVSAQLTVNVDVFRGMGA